MKRRIIVIEGTEHAISAQEVPSKMGVPTVRFYTRLTKRCGTAMAEWLEENTSSMSKLEKDPWRPITSNDRDFHHFWIVFGSFEDYITFKLRWM